MRESKTETIDGLTITVQQLPYMRSVKLLHKITRAVGPAMLKAVAGGAQKISDLDLGNAADGLQMLFDKLTADDLEHITKELLDGALLDKDAGQVPLLRNMDECFAGNLLRLFRVLKFALETNYQDFWPALQASAGALQKPPPSPSKA